MVKRRNVEVKKKVGIYIDNNVYRKAKVYCAEKDISISELFEYAVELYIERSEVIEKEIERQVFDDEIERRYYENLKKNNGYVKVIEYKKE